MKSILRSLAAFAACFVALSLHAQTVTVPFTDLVECTPNRSCADVDGDGTTLFANDNNAGVVEVFLKDGNYYLGTGVVGLSVTNYAVYLQPNSQVSPGFNPQVMYVTATWKTWWTKGSGSGRGGYARHQHWELLSGQLLK